MNGNGSTDIVWIENPSGKVTYLDIFPKRSGLLASVQNGIGQHIEIEYGSSVDHTTQEGGTGWAHLLPSPMLTVDRIVRWAVGPSTREVRNLHYSNGYYDQAEKQFRGFSHVTESLARGPQTEEGRVEYVFDVGDADRYRKGLLLEKRTYSNGRHLSTVTSEYDDCPLAKVPTRGLLQPVRYVCLVASQSELIEGRDVSSSATTRQEYQYDGYGNRTQTSKLGVVKRGGVACGEDCEGDELFEVSEFVSPANTGGLWLLGAPYRQRVFGVAGGETKETLIYYDGKLFEGLALGTLQMGLATRVIERVSADRVITSSRSRYDSDGNMIEQLDANGHRRVIAYDSEGVLPISEEMVFDDESHSPYSLRQSLSYHGVLELPVLSTAWQRIEGDSPVSLARKTEYGYDLLGRLTAIARPGDTLEKPTQRFSYELASPVSRIVSSQRSAAEGSVYDIESAQCFDGLGRAVQTVTKTGDGLYQASGFEVYGPNDKPSRSYQPHQKNAFVCASRAPSEVLATTTYRDALGRPTSKLAPDASIYGTPSHTRNDYLPLGAIAFDPEDLDSNSPYF